jgi:hypothetical protein
MPRKAPLGRLLIAFGPEANDENSLYQHVGRFRTAPQQTTALFKDFHAGAYDDNPDPFTSRYFGPAVEALLKGYIVILTDGVFEEHRRRSKVALAFQRTFPDLAIDSVQVGGGAAIGPPGERIVFDGDVYEEGGEGSNETMVVESDADLEQLRWALTYASQRMMRVGEDGQEYTDIPVFYAPDRGLRPGTQYELAELGVDLAGREAVYTPNYVSAITEDEDGNLGFYIDCKGGIEPPMAARFRQILLEEFRKRGITSAHVRVPDK